MANMSSSMVRDHIAVMPVGEKFEIAYEKPHDLAALESIFDSVSDERLKNNKETVVVFAFPPGLIEPRGRFRIEVLAPPEK